MLLAAINEEKALLVRVADGDRQAFGLLYSNYLSSLYRYIFLFTKSKEETEEILQDIFVRIWEHREKLLEVESFRNYLFRFAKNKLLDKFRHLQIRLAVLAEIRRSRNFSGSFTSDECDYREYYRIVQQAIEKLPRRRKLIFRLNIENGFSQDEIARELKISKSVVQKQIYRATNFVRNYLFEHGEISFLLLLSFCLPGI
jgi:RNA polymerase sigma-70 factor (family 1)